MSMMIASLAGLALAAAQPADEGPIGTAVKAPALVAPSAPRPVPVAPPAGGAASLEFDPKTKVDGPALQVILGERAVFRIDDKGMPKLDSVEAGKLVAAHPAGSVTETFTSPGAGRLAAALDGSAERKATALKIWNGLDYAVDYNAVALTVRRGETLTPTRVAICAVQPGETRTEVWPAPVVAVGLMGFKAAGADAAARPACR
jgi:hypothetical protein